MPHFRPVLTWTCPLTPGLTYQHCVEEPQVKQFQAFLQRYAADHLLGMSGLSSKVLLDNLRNWAAAGALLTYPGFTPGDPTQSDSTLKYLLNWPVMPIVTTWSLLRNDSIVSTADRSLIDSWVGRLIGFSISEAGTNPPRNNHGYLAYSIKMAWAIASGNDTAFAEGVETFYIALHQMRSDGSFPAEVARGACALRYQDTAIANLLAIAELAAQQGYDLYSLTVDGKTIHQAVTFLLDAVDDPAVVAGYAAANGVCDFPPGSPMDTFSIRVGNPDDIMSAWMEPYIARFPALLNSARLPGVSTGSGNGAGLHFVQHMLKVQTACLVPGRRSAAWSVCSLASFIKISLCSRALRQRLLTPSEISESDFMRRRRASQSSAKYRTGPFATTVAVAGVALAKPISPIRLPGPQVPTCWPLTSTETLPDRRTIKLLASSPWRINSLPCALSCHEPTLRIARTWRGSKSSINAA